MDERMYGRMDGLTMIIVPQILSSLVLFGGNRGKGYMGMDGWMVTWNITYIWTESTHTPAVPKRIPIPIPIPKPLFQFSMLVTRKKRIDEPSTAFPFESMNATFETR